MTTMIASVLAFTSLTMPFGGARLGPVQGTVTVTYLPLLLPVSYGRQRTVARLRLTASAENNQALISVMFTNDGSARDADLRNFALWTNRGERLTPVVSQMNGDRVTLAFSPPFLLGRRQERLLELRADVRASRRRTIQFFIEEPSDLRATPVRVRTGY